MAKSKKQKRQEALVRLNNRMDEQEALGLQPTIAQRLEHNALTHPKRPLTELEKLFGPGDPVTGTIYADPLPRDFKPTPHLQSVVYMLRDCTERFVEVQVDLETPEGYKYATYEGSGTYLNQWVSRHTPYVLHHAKHLHGTTITLVFSHQDDVPEFDEHDVLIRGTTVEMYDRSF